jgi:hypothetical protein
MTMFRKLASIAGVAAVVAALLVPAAFGSGPNGNGGSTGSCAQAGSCVPKLDGTGRGAGSKGTGTGTCTPKRDGTGAKLGKGAGQHRGMQGWKTAAS